MDALSISYGFHIFGLVFNPVLGDYDPDRLVIAVTTTHSVPMGRTERMNHAYEPSGMGVRSVDSSGVMSGFRVNFRADRRIHSTDHMHHSPLTGLSFDERYRSYFYGSDTLPDSVRTPYRDSLFNSYSFFRKGLGRVDSILYTQDAMDGTTPYQLWSRMTYDTLGRVVGIDQNSVFAMERRFRYDDAGRLIGRTLKHQNQEFHEMRLVYHPSGRWEGYDQYRSGILIEKVRFEYRPLSAVVGVRRVERVNRRSPARHGYGTRVHLGAVDALGRHRGDEPRR